METFVGAELTSFLQLILLHRLRPGLGGLAWLGLAAQAADSAYNLTKISQAKPIGFQLASSRLPAGSSLSSLSSPSSLSSLSSLSSCQLDADWQEPREMLEKAYTKILADHSFLFQLGKNHNREAGAE